VTTKKCFRAIAIRWFEHQVSFFNKRKWSQTSNPLQTFPHRTPTRKLSNRLVSVQSSEYANSLESLRFFISSMEESRDPPDIPFNKKIFRRSSFHKQFVLLGLILVRVFLLLKLSFKRDFFLKQHLNVSCSLFFIFSLILNWKDWDFLLSLFPDSKLHEPETLATTLVS